MLYLLLLLLLLLSQRASVMAWRSAASARYVTKDEWKGGVRVRG